jgi:hypothetical protein
VSEHLQPCPSYAHMLWYIVKLQSLSLSSDWKTKRITGIEIVINMILFLAGYGSRAV